MSVTSSSTTSKRSTDTFLRGVSIVCVIIIHFLSSFKESPYINESPYQLFAVSLDQLARLAVPLFVALSGYGLMVKYQHAAFRWHEYLTKRVFKLLPLYILWSFIYWFIFLVLPQWRPTPEMKPFIGQLFLGNADYHLYFVPMIFQLYVLFPFLLTLVKKYPKIIFAGAAMFQLLFYLVIGERVTDQPGTTFFQSDQKQYIWFFTWIFYFVLGMCIPKILHWISKVEWREIIVYLLTAGAAVLVSASALSAIQHGVDPLVALRFTRWQVLAFSCLAIISMFLITRKTNRFPKWSIVIGQNSYLLFLSHTLLLRILFLAINPQE